MKLSNSTTESPLSIHFRRFVALTTLPAFRLWGAAGTQYIPLKNMKSATGFFSIVIFYFHFVSFIFLMEPRGSSYFSSEHTVYSPAVQFFGCETWLLQLLPHLKLPLLGMDCILPIFLMTLVWPAFGCPLASKLKHRFYA